MKAETNTVWISAELLDWDYNPTSSGSTKIDWYRPYDIWSHAEELLNKPTTNLYLVDAITTLKRAVNQRLSQLNEIYCFDQIPVTEKPKRLLEQLAFWELVRPSMLKQLIDIRNAVEHEDAVPPTQERCFEFLDFVWYFLRSTDFLARTLIDEVEFEDDEIHYRIDLFINPNPNWDIKLGGSISHSMLSLTDISGWIRLELEHMQTVEQFLSALGGSSKPYFERKYQHHQPNDLVISGKVLGEQEHIEKI